MRLFVTGASGFIGGRFTRAAVDAGHQVTAMARSDASVKAVEALGATAVRCELGKVQAEHLAGVDAIVHCAAYVEQTGTRADFFRVNVDGTVQLLQAAREAKVKRFVLVSTEAVLFYGQHLRDVDEAHPYPRFTPFLYAESKAAQEQAVLQANGHGLTTLAIRPRLVWGPGDVTILPVVAEMVRTGRFRWIDGGRARTNTTHVDNVVHALLLALEKGKGGHAYFVTDDELTSMKDFLTQYLSTVGLTPGSASVPSWLLSPIAGAVETVWSLVGAKSAPPLTKLATALMSRDCTLRIDKARDELGYAPVVRLDQGLEALRRGNAKA